MTAVIGALAVGLAVALAWWMVRRGKARHMEQAVRDRYRRNADGVIVGAEPQHLSGSRRGAILLLHGYNDSPQSLAVVAHTLHARGWTVQVPLLPGHGRTLSDFAASGADMWIAAARAALEEMRHTHRDIAVGGLSMGGAISLLLAASQPDLRAVILFAPYLHSTIWHRLYRFALPLLAVGPRYLYGGGARSVRDPVASETMIAYRCSTPRLLWQLERVVHAARAVLPDVREPLLLVQSREDNRIPSATTVDAFQRIASTDKTLHWVTGVGHVVTVDYSRDEVSRVAADWLESRLA